MIRNSNVGYEHRVKTYFSKVLG